MFYIAADYNPNYSWGTVSMIAICLEIGWTVYDHVRTISSFHRAFALCINKKEKAIVTLMLAGTLTAGVILRILRCPCRFGTCIVSTDKQLDSAIATNNLIGELMMITVLVKQCLLFNQVFYF
jgi:hypothetical protein